MPPARFPKVRFTLKSLLVLILGIAIGFSLNLQTWKLLTGRSRYASLPQYVIEPPDVLKIDIIGGDSDHRVPSTNTHLVGPDGRINLGEWGSLYDVVAERHHLLRLEALVGEGLALALDLGHVPVLHETGSRLEDADVTARCR